MTIRFCKLKLVILKRFCKIFIKPHQLIFCRQEPAYPINNRQYFTQANYDLHHAGTCVGEFEVNVLLW